MSSENYVPDPRPAKRCPPTFLTPLPRATGADQNQPLIERLAEFLFIGVRIPWDWY